MVRADTVFAFQCKIYCWYAVYAVVGVWNSNAGRKNDAVMSCMRVCRKQALSRVKYYYYY